MKKLFLLSVLIFLWNCGATQKKGVFHVSKKGAKGDSAQLKLTDKLPEFVSKAITISPTESKKNFNNDALYQQYLQSRHEISAIQYEKYVDTYLRSIGVRGINYWTLPLLEHQEFNDAVRKAVKENKYVKIIVPPTDSAEDFKFSIANGFCDFGDGISVYHGEFLQYLLEKNPIEFKIIKGKEAVEKKEYDVEKCTIQKNDYVEAMFYLKFYDGSKVHEEYYNISSDPTIH